MTTRYKPGDKVPARIGSRTGKPDGPAKDGYKVETTTSKLGKTIRRFFVNSIELPKTLPLKSQPRVMAVTKKKGVKRKSAIKANTTKKKATKKKACKKKSCKPKIITKKVAMAAKAVSKSPSIKKAAKTIKKATPAVQKAVAKIIEAPKKAQTAVAVIVKAPKAMRAKKVRTSKLAACDKPNFARTGKILKGGKSRCVRQKMSPAAAKEARRQSGIRYRARQKAGLVTPRIPKRMDL